MKANTFMRSNSATFILATLYNEDQLLNKIHSFNPIALRKAKIVYNFGLSECNRVKRRPRIANRKLQKLSPFLKMTEGYGSVSIPFNISLDLVFHWE